MFASPLSPKPIGIGLSDKSRSAAIKDSLTIFKAMRDDQRATETHRQQLAQRARRDSQAPSGRPAQTLPDGGGHGVGPLAAGPEVIVQGGPQGTDTVPAWLTPGEAVIPAPAAQNPANKKAIASLINEGRMKNGGVVPPLKLADGTETVSPFSDWTAAMWHEQQWSSLSPEQKEEIDRWVTQQESNGDPNAVSPAGARSSRQIMPQHKVQGYAGPDGPRAWDGTEADAKRYSMELRDHYGRGRSVADTLQAYHSGPGKGYDKLGPEGRAYVPSMLSKAGMEYLTPEGLLVKPQGRISKDAFEALRQAHLASRADTPSAPLNLTGYSPARDSHNANPDPRPFIGYRVPRRQGAPGGFTGKVTLLTGQQIRPAPEAPEALPLQAAQEEPPTPPDMTRIDGLSAAEWVRNIEQEDLDTGMAMSAAARKKKAEVDRAAAEAAAKQINETLDNDAVIASRAQGLELAAREMGKRYPDGKPPQDWLARQIASLWGPTGLVREEDLGRFAMIAAGGLLFGGSLKGSLRYAALDLLKNSDQRRQTEQQTDTHVKEDTRQKGHQLRANIHESMKQISEPKVRSRINKYLDAFEKEQDPVVALQLMQDAQQETTAALSEIANDRRIALAERAEAVANAARARAEAAAAVGDKTKYGEPQSFVDSRSGEPVSLFRVDRQGQPPQWVLPTEKGFVPVAGHLVGSQYKPYSVSRDIREAGSKHSSKVIRDSVYQALAAGGKKVDPLAVETRAGALQAAVDAVAAELPAGSYAASTLNNELSSALALRLVNDPAIRVLDAPALRQFVSQELLKVRANGAANAAFQVDDRKGQPVRGEHLSFEANQKIANGLKAFINDPAFKKQLEGVEDKEGAALALTHQMYRTELEKKTATEAGRVRIYGNHFGTFGDRKTNGYAEWLANGRKFNKEKD